MVSTDPSVGAAAFWTWPAVGRPEAVCFFSPLPQGFCRRDVLDADDRGCGAVCGFREKTGKMLGEPRARY